MLSIASKDRLPAWHRRPSLIDSRLDTSLCLKASILIELQEAIVVSHNLAISESFFSETKSKEPASMFVSSQEYTAHELARMQAHIHCCSCSLLQAV